MSETGNITNQSEPLPDLKQKFRLMISVMAETNVPAALAQLETLPEGDLQRDLARAVLTGLAESNAFQAATFAADLPSPLAQQMAAAVASVWVKRDAASAIAWVRNLPEGRVRDEVSLSISADWSAIDPQAAAEFSLGFLADAPQLQMLGIVGVQWAQTDAAAALAWADGLGDADARDAFLGGVSSSLAETLPAEAAQVAASISPGPAQDNAALSVVLQWGRLDPKAAAEWVKMFPPGEMRLKTLLQLISTLAEQDPQAPQTLLHNWPASAERDEAIRHYFTATLDLQSALMSSLLSEIQNPALREEETERLEQHLSSSR